jgi:hypothetical protein
MSSFLNSIQRLITAGQVGVSEHGYDELAADDINVRDVVNGSTEAEIIEEYPDYRKGPCLLVLQRDHEGKPIHVVWGVPRGEKTPAVLVTAYRPDPERWTSDFMRRKS